MILMAGTSGQTEIKPDRNLQGDSAITTAAGPDDPADDVVVTEGEVWIGEPVTCNGERIYTSAEVLPKFEGGDKAIDKFFMDNIRTPEVLCKDGKPVKDRVLLRVCVDTLGHVRTPEIMRGSHPDLNREALRVANLLPDFTPGMMGGKKVNVWYVIPVRFRFKSEHNGRGN